MHRIIYGAGEMSIRGLISKSKLNAGKILNVSLGVFSLLVTFGGTFLSWDIFSLGKKDVVDNGIAVYIFRLLIIGLVFLFVAIVSTVYVCSRKSNKIWKRGSGEIIIEYGNIFRLQDDISSPHIIVIPVNDAFDTIVDDDPTKNKAPLVSRHTNHGKWIKHMQEQGWEISYIDEKIEKSLVQLNGVESREIPKESKGRGKLKSYPIGTVAFITCKKNTYSFLLVLSEFDENNNAKSFPENVVKAISGMIDYYDKHGQGYDLYVPLMGAGMSRANLSKQESLEIMKSTILANSWRIHGKVHIVIYEKEKDELSIFD